MQRSRNIVELQLIDVHAASLNAASGSSERLPCADQSGRRSHDAGHDELWRSGKLMTCCKLRSGCGADIHGAGTGDSFESACVKELQFSLRNVWSMAWHTCRRFRMIMATCLVFICSRSMVVASLRVVQCFFC